MAVLAGGYAVLAWSSARGSPAWVKASKSSGARVALGPGPAAYRVTYQVDSGSPVGSSVATEVLEVQRPFHSRLTTRAGRPPGGAVTQIQISDLGKLEEQSPHQDPSVLVPPPDVAASDLRLDVELNGLVRAGAVQVRERRRVDGRLCQVYRTTAPPQGQTLGKLPAAEGDAVDSCIDGRGLVLEQLQWSKKHLLNRRRAVSIDVNPALAPHALDVTADPTAPTDTGGGRIVPLDPTQPHAGATFSLDHPPSGFAFQGRYAMTQSTPPNGSGLSNGNRQAGLIDVWVSGPDALILDQGGLLYGGNALAVNPLAVDIELGPLGHGKAVPGTRTSQVSVTLPDGRYARLVGTLPVDRLAELARTLRRVDQPVGP